MKLSILSLAVASAGLLASASPLRVVTVMTDAGPVSKNVSAADVDHPHVEPVAVAVIAAPKMAGICAGAHWRQKATSLAESFRIALGFGEHKHHAQHNHHDGKNGAIAFKPIPTSPLPFLGTSNANGLASNGETPGGDSVHIVNAAPSHFPHHQRKIDAVALVLGGGFGALMAFVLLILFFCAYPDISSRAFPDLFRAFRAFRSRFNTIKLDEHTVVELDSDAEEILVVPPMYTYPVEKVEVEVATTPAAEESQ